MRILMAPRTIAVTRRGELSEFRRGFCGAGTDAVQ